MAQIDINKLNIKLGNFEETEESKTSKQVETANEIDESVDNTLETAEDNNETATETEDETKSETELNGKVIVRYVGGGIWKDGEGKLWASENKSENILSERQYTADEYENREDIKFMVSYGAMQETHVK